MKTNLCRLMLFALSGTGIALILTGVGIPSFTTLQTDHWLAGDEVSGETKETVRRVIERMDNSIQLGLIALGSFIFACSAIGIWSYWKESKPNVDVAKAWPSEPSKNRDRLRAVVFGLMFVGTIVACFGITLEERSRPSISVFQGGRSSEDLLRERQRADIMKGVGIIVMIMAPVTGAVGSLILKKGKNPASETSTNPDRLRLLVFGLMFVGVIVACSGVLRNNRLQDIGIIIAFMGPVIGIIGSLVLGKRKPRA